MTKQYDTPTEAGEYYHVAADAIVATIDKIATTNAVVMYKLDIAAADVLLIATAYNYMESKAATIKMARNNNNMMDASGVNDETINASEAMNLKIKVQPAHKVAPDVADTTDNNVPSSTDNNATDDNPMNDAAAPSCPILNPINFPYHSLTTKVDTDCQVYFTLATISDVSIKAADATNKTTNNDVTNDKSMMKAMATTYDHGTAPAATKTANATTTDVVMDDEDTDYDTDCNVLPMEATQDEEMIDNATNNNLADDNVIVPTATTKFQPYVARHPNLLACLGNANNDTTTNDNEADNDDAKTNDEATSDNVTTATKNNDATVPAMNNDATTTTTSDDMTDPRTNDKTTTALINDNATNPMTNCDALTSGNAAVHSTANDLTTDADVMKKAADVMANDDATHNNMTTLPLYPPDDATANNVMTSNTSADYDKHYDKEDYIPTADAIDDPSNIVPHPPLPTLSLDCHSLTFIGLYLEDYINNMVTIGDDNFAELRTELFWLEDVTFSDNEGDESSTNVFSDDDGDSFDPGGDPLTPELALVDVMYTAAHQIMLAEEAYWVYLKPTEATIVDCYV